jgi:hypothetical protein
MQDIVIYSFLNRKENGISESYKFLPEQKLPSTILMLEK